MSSLNRPYSVIAAALAGLALVAAIVLFALRGWELTTQVALVAALLLAGLFVLLEPAWVMGRITGRSAKYGANAVVLAVAVVAILGSLAYLSTHYTKRYDTTANGQFSLADQTVNILKSLKQPIQAVGYYSDQDPQAQTARDLMREYTSRSNLITYDTVDPVLRPAQARQAGVTSPSIVLSSGGKQQTIISVDEQSITGAIIKLTQDKPRTVYFTTGHREYDPKSGGSNGYTGAGSKLQQDGYNVVTVNLAISNTIPSDATALVVAGPQSAFSDAEANAVKSYLDKGGRGLFLLDPPADPTARDPLADVLAQWGIRPRSDVIVADPGLSLAGDRLTPLVTQYAPSTVTNGLAGATTFFPRARSLETVSPPPTTVTVTPLIQTGPQSWGETDFAGLRSGQAKPDANDARGPLTLMATAETASAGSGSSAPTTRVAVVGNASFLADSILQQVGGSANTDLFMNAVNWLAQSEELNGIRAKTADTRQVIISGDQSRWLFFASVVFLPALVLAWGGWVWWQRR